jgi:hypothetical protein
MQNLSLFESYSQPLTLDNHLSFSFNDYVKPDLDTFTSLTDKKSYIPIPSCILEHILTTTNLTCYEKLYYLLADSLSIIGKNGRITRSCALPSEDWAKYLGCSRSLIFTMQKSLEQKGYFIINKHFDNIGRNKRNLITPTLPLAVFNHLNKQFPDRVGEHSPYNPLTECKRSYLDRTKLFIKLNYHLLKIIAASNYLNAKQKILWLSFYTRCYKDRMLKAREDFTPTKYGDDSSSFAFISSYKEIALEHSSNTKDLSKSLRKLEETGFLKAQNIYARKKNFDGTSGELQERQDESLWKITLSLPKNYILELDKLKDRSNLILNDIKITTSNGVVTENLIVDCLILDGTKFYLNREQSEFLKSLIDGNSDDNDIITPISPLLHTLSNESCIDSTKEEVIGLKSDIDDGKKEELEMFCKTDGGKIFSHTKNTPLPYSPLTGCKEEEKSEEIKFDPTFAKSGLLLNRDSKIKIFKSNLRALPKVLFNDFLKKLKRTNSTLEEKSPSKKKTKQFNICSELIRNKLKELPQDKADKARKYAYSIFSKKLAKSYAASLSKEELAKQLIHHAATWKPTQLGNISREKEIDTALAVAWKSIVSGTWQPPLEVAKAEVLQYEYQYYRKKYQESGVVSHEIKSLGIEVNKLLGGWYDLEKEIKLCATSKFSKITKLNNEHYRSYGSVLQNDSSKNRKYIIGETKKYAVNIENNIALSNFKEESGRNHQTRPQLFQSFRELEHKDKMPKLDYSHYSFETELPENEATGNNMLYKVDLSNLSDSQKHLSLRDADKEIIEITTADNKRYFAKLKAMEVDEHGELIITFIPNTQREFIERKEIFSLNAGNKTPNFPDPSNQLTCYQYNITESCEKDVDCIQDRVQGFKSLDEAVSGIFDKLLCIKGNSD